MPACTRSGTQKPQSRPASKVNIHRPLNSFCSKCRVWDKSGDRKCRVGTRVGMRVGKRAQKTHQQPAVTSACSWLGSHISALEASTYEQHDSTWKQKQALTEHEGKPNRDDRKHKNERRQLLHNRRHWNQTLHAHIE